MIGSASCINLQLLINDNMLLDIDTYVLICRIPHLENFSGNDKNALLAQIIKCKQIFVLYTHKNA